MKHRFLLLLCAALLTLALSGCRTPVNKPESLMSLKGRKMRVKTEFFIIPLQNTRGTIATYQDLSPRPGVGEHLVISPGDICTILGFVKLSESLGGYLAVVVRIHKEGQDRIAEIRMLPNYNLPGKNEAERTEYKLRNKDNHSWVLIDE